MACEISQPVIDQMARVGVTDPEAIMAAYRKNNENLFTQAPIYQKLLDELIAKDDPNPEDSALLYTFISFTPKYRANKKEQDITLESLQAYHENQLQLAAYKKRDIEAQVNQTEIYSASLKTSSEDPDPLILSEVIGMELFQSLNALALSARSLENAKQHFEQLLAELQKRKDNLKRANRLTSEGKVVPMSLTANEEQSYAYLSKVVSKFPEVIKWYEGIKKAQDEFNAFTIFREESEDPDDSDESYVPAEERSRRGEDWTKSSVHVAELAGTKLKNIVASLPIIETVPVIERGRLAFKKQVRKGKIFMSNLASNKDVSNYNTISAIVGSAKTYYEAYERLQIHAETHPQIQALIDVLPPKEYEEKDVPLVGDFMNVFGLPEISPYVVNISKSVSKKDLLSARVYKKLSNSTKFLLDNYDRNILRSGYRKAYFSKDGQGLDFRKILSDQEYNLTKKLYDYSKSKDLRQFLRTNSEGYDMLMEFFFRLGIDEALEFKTTGAYYGQAFEFFTIRDNLNAALSLQAKVMAYLKVAPGGEVKITAPLDFLYSFSQKDMVQGEPKKTELEKFMKIINQTHPERYSPSYLNAGNKLKNAISQKFHLTQVVDKINAAADMAELIQNNPEYDFTKNPDILGSVLFSKNFVKIEGTAKLLFPTTLNALSADMSKSNLNVNSREDLLVYASQFKRVSTFKVVSLSGIERKIPGKKLIADVTPTLTPAGKFMQDFISFFDVQFIENPRFGEKTSSYGIEIERPNWLKADYYKYHIPLNYFKSPEDRAIADQADIQKVFSGYLRAELRTIYHNIINGKPSGVFGDKSTTLFFGDMSETPAPWLKELQAKIDNLVETYRGKEFTIEDKKELLGELNKIAPEYIAGFMESFSEFIAEETTLAKAMLLEEMGNMNRLVNFFNTHDVTKKGITITPENIDYFISFYLKNGIIQNIEFFKIFVGSLANFNKTAKNFREVFKRIVNMSSPGKIPVVDETIKSIYANSEDATKFSTLYNGNGSGRRWGVLNTLVYNDVDTFFGGKEELWKAYREAYDLPNTSEYKAYVNGPKEADAQAVSTLEFYRNYLNSTGSWTDGQTVTYNLEFKIAQYLKSYLEEKSKEVPDLNRLQELMASIRNVREEINVKIQLGEADPFPPLKLGHYGRSTDDAQQSVYHKMSVFPLLPSTVSTKMTEEDFQDIANMMQSMFVNDMDYYVFKSGSKQATPKALLDYYNSDGSVNTNFKVDDATVLDVRNLRELQYQAPKFKKKSVLTTQGFKLLFSDLFDKGNFQGTPEFKEFVESQISLLSQSTDAIIQANLYALDKKLGITRKEAAEGEIGEVESYDEQKLAQFLVSKYSETEEIRKYIQVKDGQITYNLSGFRNINKVNLTLLNEITNKIISIKLNGDSLIQAAQTPLLGRRKMVFTKEDFKKNGAVGLSNGLKFYRIENGVVMPMEIMVAWHPEKHAPLLELEYLGKKLKDYSDPTETINKILEESTPEDVEWMKKHMKKFMYAGVRIPVQGHNSMESMKVKKFLPSSQGPTIILPPQIVTKSGGDYDIDKMTVYYPNLDSQGNIIKSKISLAQYKKSIAEIARIKTSLGFSEETLWNLAQYTKGKKEYANVRKKLMDTYFQVQKKATKAKYFPVQKLKGTPAEIKADIEMEIAKAEYLLEELEPLDSFSEGMENNIIDVFHNILSRTELYETLIRPNDSPVAKAKAESITSRKLRAMDVYSPYTSYRIFKENISAGKALGIDAKMNTAQKMFQQVGLKLSRQSVLGYKFPANRSSNGDIELGSIYFADSERKISNILNEFINGHVDAGNEDFLLRLGMNNTITPIAHTMLVKGTNEDIVFSFLSEPEVLKAFMRTQDNNLFGVDKITLRNQLRLQQANVSKEMLGLSPAETTPLHRAFNQAIALSRRSRISMFDAVSQVVEELDIDIFSSLNKNFKLDKIFNEKGEYVSEVVKYFTLHQMAIINQSQRHIRQLTSITDFNTARTDNPLKLFLMKADIAGLENVFANLDSLYSRTSSLPLTKFNLIETVMDMFQKLSPEVYNDYVLEEAMEAAAKYNLIGKERTEFVTNFTSNFINGFQALYNSDSRRGRHASYFFAPGSGQFVKVKEESPIESRYKEFLRNNPDLMDNKFINNLSWKDEVFNEITYTIPKSINIRLGESLSAEIQEALAELMFHPDPVGRELISDLLLGTHYATISRSSPTNIMIPADVYNNLSNNALAEIRSYFGANADIKRKDMENFLLYISALTSIQNATLSPAVFMAMDVNYPSNSGLLTTDTFYRRLFDRSFDEDLMGQTVMQRQAEVNSSLNRMISKVKASVRVAPTDQPSAPTAAPVTVVKTKTPIDKLQEVSVPTPDAIKFVRKDKVNSEGYFEELSNFVASSQEIVDDMGLTYKSVEAYYQAQKTLDINERKKFTSDQLKTPYEYGNKAKLQGRSVTERPDWANVKYEVMRQGLAQKFQDPRFKELLLSTGNKEIIEWTWWNDVTWGMSTNSGKGANALGKLLMELRDNLQEPQPATKKRGFKLSIDKKGKDQGKADLATAFLSYPNPNTSSYQYMQDAKAQGIPVNDEIDVQPGTVVFVSVNGNNKATAKQIEDTYLAAREIILEGGTVVMDSTEDANRSWNKSGEALVQAELGMPSGQTSKGYNYWGPNPEIDPDPNDLPNFTTNTKCG